MVNNIRGILAVPAEVLDTLSITNANIVTIGGIHEFCLCFSEVCKGGVVGGPVGRECTIIKRMDSFSRISSILFEPN